ncbi:RNA-binding protein [Candidatus Desantisbacteria bacterium CG_4_10_14_0_8_um_filter_48_22]|uniref:RNA-binding protein KhpA n=1 Tax=Candidatus Desantisbacteria bacterium CG_4_10_14_0_8_um_filter_48_22 TaxID=1974543 RepID=A0A2M7SFV3_9BACT|nr:MAG: RNA-binding protein [Candidatus Desantisbacteria bacterium CG1_02_49_89]PIV56715.1 MAG: RNA-binding protein [Candidatus Desantisbacteria bacterium CG02_land_8_20_14_3_00_49_13]PIZ18173.1 MAG: RNA-binding protein [Candidatus Desantisbacteria bacterium CG_4_10_14_0_8_um_filter_48_22]PJB28305.1 MAG: RNA-binding protein [Candidatus Desantisbacteria bacterium CG_4_9_14_3_um_filter_50_7]
MKTLVEYIVKCIVDKKDEVEVKSVEGDKSIVLEIKVAQEDMGKVIGKEGRTIKAIRTLLGAAATKIGKKVMVELLQ